MLKLMKSQDDLWYSILPDEVRTLPAELSKVDEILKDKRFFKPFQKKFDTQMGRPTLPVETYLRLMYLKARYQLGYESLIQEVGDSITWRLFCGISLTQCMPNPTTLIKSRQRYGDEMVDSLNTLLLEKLREEKVLKTRKFRTDTTVVEADIHHPTDATLLQDAVKTITRVVSKVREVASHATEHFVDQTKAVKKEILSIAKVLRRRTKQSWDEINTITQSVIEITETVCQDAQTVVNKLQAKSRESRKAVEQKLANTLEITKKLIWQARQVVAGNRKIANRIISIHDPEARAIKKGKLGKTAEFGYKVRIDETDNGFVTGHEVYRGNPSDEEMLTTAVQQHKERFGSVPRAVATDRGFSSRQNEKALEELGVGRISTPTRGKKTKKRTEHESQAWFKDLQRFRAGGEAKISLLKRRYGLSRSRFRGYVGTKTWVGLGIMAHNLRKAAQVS